MRRMTLVRALGDPRFLQAALKARTGAELTYLAREELQRLNRTKEATNDAKFNLPPMSPTTCGQ